MAMIIPIAKARREEVFNDWKLDGKPYPKMSRKEEFEYCRQKFPHIPKTILLKNHTAQRGIQFTDEAWEKYDANKDLKPYIGLVFQRHKKNHTEKLAVPLDFMYSDGTNSMFCLSPPENDPYTIDYIDGKYWMTGDGEVLEEVLFHTKPKYYDKLTSSGQLMQHIGMTIGSDTIVFSPVRHCHYFAERNPTYGKNACRFCDMDPNTQLQMKMGRGFKTRIQVQDVYETMAEALKEEGRWRHHFYTGGSDPRNNFQQEFEVYRDMIAAASKAGKEVGIDRLPLYPLMCPLDKARVQEIYDAGASAYCVHIEVLGKDKFDRQCPGKAQAQGYEFFMQSMIDAVDVFGPGNVQAGLVAGIELMDGYNDIKEAVNDTLEGMDFLFQHGIVPGGTCLTIEPGSALYKEGQKEPPLEFFCLLDDGRHALSQKYKLSAKFYGYKSQLYTPFADWQRYM